ncbi:hypothetical protein TSUD_371690 [Trifolium subterraneum]|uniref:Reverse transcriptase zinc-binding domain-containing protein n=1 Tax=Trifolium subterraneum TaxID=3900 RepID=A0A2Z6PIN1_TRISU|nr:hypothetical protein TSUD_371690 [Trifolium subterraneum]
MINAVLNAIPIFYLSLLKIPVKILKQVICIQREFLWGGVRGENKIKWVKWSMVCKEKSKGGLGVRDVRLANLSLLAKWRWRLLLPGNPLWKEVLVAKYGNHILNRVDWRDIRIPTLASKWWKDICTLDKVVDNHNWLAESMIRKVGNGTSTSFWCSNWIGEAPLSVTFPLLFSLSNHKNGMVRNFCDHVGENWRWSFSWRRDLFQWEEDLVVRLREILEPVVLSLVEDFWSWKLDPEGKFSVKSAYTFLVEELTRDDDLEEAMATVFDQIWDSPAPSKVIAFSWQLLSDRIPTRRNLEIRGLLGLDMPWECVGCVGRVESTTHLFLHCPSAMMVWYEVFRWLGVVLIIPPSMEVLFEVLRGSVRIKKIRRGYLMIWHATLWCIWKAQNKALFANGTFIPKEIVEEIKVVSWKWCLARTKVSLCMFYEWTWDPGDCLLR